MRSSVVGADGLDGVGAGMHRVLVLQPVVLGVAFAVPDLPDHMATGAIVLLSYLIIRYLAGFHL